MTVNPGMISALLVTAFLLLAAVLIRMAVDGDRLEPQQLGQGAHKNVRPGGKEVGPQKAGSTP